MKETSQDVVFNAVRTFLSRPTAQDEDKKLVKELRMYHHYAAAKRLEALSSQLATALETLEEVRVKYPAIYKNFGFEACHNVLVNGSTK